MNKKTTLFFSCFFMLSIASQSQVDSVVLPDRYYRHNYENDFFASTDRYYTQGVYLEFFLPVFKKTLLAKTLISLNPRGRRTGKRVVDYYGMSLERQGFTPRSIRHEGIFYGERPFAAVAYVTHSLISIDMERRIRLTSRINLGFMGPNLRGAQEQKGIHYALNNIQPLGWENQIENDYVLNYDVFLEKGLINGKHIELTGIAEARIGTLYDDFALGTMIRVGWMQPYFNNLGTTRQKNVRKFQCYLYAKGKLKAVAYNATMQGGMINRNSIYTIPPSDIERIVGLGYVGVVVAYKRLGLEYSRAIVSPEFKNGLVHEWGRIGINVCF
ncbi:MAG: lipid A deacylase LpxR family protein [Bacteroidetes bacterium]|nr:lipid A deacylase LpxR family protein [Bacteroidota bacterium]